VVEQYGGIERLQTIIAHLRRIHFGRKAEKIEHDLNGLSRR